MSSIIRRLIIAACLLMAFPYSVVHAESLSPYATMPESVSNDSLSRPTILNRIASPVLSAAINCAVTEGLKSSVHKMRPDRSDNHSFPSRHASWAFTLASIASAELYRHSPWWAVGAQTVATGIGLQRVWSRNHYGSDVFAGMLCGVASTAAGYYLGNLIGGKRTVRYDAEYLCGASVETTSMASFITGGQSLKDGSKLKACSGFGYMVSYKVPMRHGWYVHACAGFASYTVRTAPTSTDALNMPGVEIGAGKAFRLGRSTGFETEAGAGCAAVANNKKFGLPSAVFTASLKTKIAIQTTKHFCWGISAGYSLAAFPNTISSITAGCFSRVCF